MGGMKRAHSALVPLEAKRSKDASLEHELGLVVPALDGASSSVSASSRAMLRAMAPACFVTPPGQRHRYQAAVGDMLRECCLLRSATLATKWRRRLRMFPRQRRHWGLPMIAKHLRVKSWAAPWPPLTKPNPASVAATSHCKKLTGHLTWPWICRGEQLKKCTGQLQ